MSECNIFNNLNSEIYKTAKHLGRTNLSITHQEDAFLVIVIRVTREPIRNQHAISFNYKYKQIHHLRNVFYLKVLNMGALKESYSNLVLQFFQDLSKETFIF